MTQRTKLGSGLSKLLNLDNLPLGNTDSVLINAYSERPSPRVGEIATICRIGDRDVATIDANGDIAYFEDARRAELNAEIDRLKAREQELLEANNRYQQEARYAKAWAKHLEENTHVLSGMLHLQYQKEKHLEAKFGHKGDLGEILNSGHTVAGVSTAGSDG